jgi:rare lipoprotein A
MKPFTLIALGVGAVALYAARKSTTTATRAGTMSTRRMPTAPLAQGPVIESGLASWYGEQFHGRQTANQEIFDMNGISAAHRTMKLGSIIDVVNLDNGRAIRVRVNDRGPYTKTKDGDFARILDLSKAAAIELGYLDKGLANILIRSVPADNAPNI